MHKTFISPSFITSAVLSTSRPCTKLFYYFLLQQNCNYLEMLPHSHFFMEIDLQVLKLNNHIHITTVRTPILSWTHEKYSHIDSETHYTYDNTLPHACAHIHIHMYAHTFHLIICWDEEACSSWVIKSYTSWILVRSLMLV